MKVDAEETQNGEERSTPAGRGGPFMGIGCLGPGSLNIQNGRGLGGAGLEFSCGLLEILNGRGIKCAQLEVLTMVN